MNIKTLSKLFVVFFIAVGLLMGFLIFNSLYPYRTVEYLNVPFPILNENQTVVAGGELSYVVEYCRYTNLVTHTARSLINEIIYTLPSAEVSSAKGCASKVTIISIPKEIAPGTYHIESNLTWIINAFRTVSKTVETQSFTIISPDRE